MTLASGFADDKDALPIRADARVLGATLKAGETVEYRARRRRVTAISCRPSGAVEVNGVRIDARDGAAISERDGLRITALEDARNRPGRRRLTRSPTTFQRGDQHGESSRSLLFSLRPYRNDGAGRRRGRARSRRQRRHQARAGDWSRTRSPRPRHFKLDQAAPVAKIEDLADYDAIIVGTGTRFGRMSLANGELSSIRPAACGRAAR